MQPKIAAAESSFAQLRARLLAIGGKGMVEEPEPHVEILLARGKLYDDLRLKIVPSETSSCHLNTLLAHSRTPGSRFVRGWNLRGGVWRQHSWLLAQGCLLESKFGGSHYYGVELVQAEVEALADSGILGHIKHLLPTIYGQG